jgi:hypothetical protein
MAIRSYLENNLFYKIINIELFRTIDNYEHYYKKFILLSDGLIDLKKKGKEGAIKNIIDNRIEKILQDRLNGYLKDIGKIDKEYIYQEYFAFQHFARKVWQLFFRNLRNQNKSLRYRR